MPGILIPEISKASTGAAITPTAGAVTPAGGGGGSGNKNVTLTGRLFAATRGTIGTIGGTGAGATDTWAKVSNGIKYAVGNDLGGPDLGQGWWKSTIDNAGQLFISAGGKPDAPNKGTYLFDPGTGNWNRTNTDTTHWFKNLGASENYDICYNTDLGVMYRGVGGPYAWGVYPTSPLGGDQRYVPPPVDEFFTDYPSSDSTYSPVTPDDVAHWNAAGKGNTVSGFDAALEYHQGALYAFAFPDGRGVRKRTLATGVVTSLSNTNPPPQSTSTYVERQWRSGIDHRTGMLWTLADGFELYVHYVGGGIVTKGWTHITTTGNKPAITPPSGYTDPTEGIMADLYEDANCIVAWCGKNASVVVGGMTTYRQTWVLDLTTMVWRGPITTAATPPGNVTVAQDILFNKARGAITLLVSDGPSLENQVWEFSTSSPGESKIYSVPLPALSGSTLFVNYYGFPFCSNHGSKHVCMAYCPTNNRLYAQGGDIAWSAQDGTYSMDCATGDWQLEVGLPVYPTLPAPHALQDGFGFAWMPSRNKFILWPGSYYWYDSPGAPLINYARGIWFFDPFTHSYEQQTSLFMSDYASTTCVQGGVYDPVTDAIYAFKDSAGGAFGAMRWDISTMTGPTTYAFSVPNPQTGYSGKYFNDCLPALLDRWIYFVGYATDGTNKLPMAWRWNVDTHTLEEIARPPTDTSVMSAIENRLCVSNGKIVWLFVNGPEGGLTIGGVLGPARILNYNPSTNTWTEDFRRPPYGNFIGNSFCSMDGKRIAWSGGEFGLQQTHMWFYEAPTA